MSTSTTAEQAASQPLFCKDCRYIEAPSKVSASSPTCSAVAAQAIDLVHGYFNPPCSVSRTEQGACGPDARLFNPAQIPATSQRAPYEGLSTPLSARSRSSLSMKNRASVVSSANTVATTSAGTAASLNTDAQIDLAVTKRS